MDNQLIEQLAQKFSTTTEHLWGVLINQAAVSATISLIWLIICTAGIVIIYNFYKANNRKDDWENFPEFLFGISFGVYVIVVTALTSNIIIGYLNPEYWALNDLLK